ncbi:PQQ-dependent sugar dehydrogenase [Jannaschia aquimarina]|uniref:YliI protein n=1 Tax=Jannaschia aquimarina TaxID=935700 RepID=A0A0D1DDK2_9RHOB|nr:PQQ-dependent sugar dehydrogenase [Jannaschia aquimarina]KIT18073.1 Soluble aldose sugar dehydrogenase YliI precursor [Jannaschia aquimarina]SNS89800.1 Glucose/arabinose dehydrogenase, beta-propeller fold [Jannaschia aquimarina]
MIRALPLLLLAAPACAQDFTWGERNTSLQPAFDQQFRAKLASTDVELRTEVLAGDLVHPWGIAVLPGDAGYLVTERSGSLRHIASDGALSDPIANVPAVLDQNQGGLLDVAVGPTFAEDRVIYLTYAKPLGDGMSATAAARAVLSEDLSTLSDVQDIFVQAPPSPTPMHYGSRIVFLPDGTAAITTGEHSRPAERVFAQDLDKTYGKVIRVNLDGSTPDDNPFVGQDGAVDTIWSYGHRNIQGAVVAEDGTLWTIEHGPAGGDELNRPEAGLNYGWPVISYGENYNGSDVGEGIAVQQGMEQPVYFWDPVIAPGGMMFHAGDMFGDWNGDLLIGSLYPGGVVRLSLDDEGFVVEEERLLRDIGRVRDVEVLEDGSFLILTDYADGAVIRVTASGSEG